MPLPDLTSHGLMPPGVWPAKLEEIIVKFCATRERQPFAQALENIAAYAFKTGASRIILGGSFVTASPSPSDLDILVVYPKDEQISTVSKGLDIDDVVVDIVFCSEERQALLSGYVTLFSRSRGGDEVGVIELGVRTNKALEEIVEYTDEATLDAMRWAYFRRHINVPKSGKKILVTIHGIKSHAAWNADVTRMASAAGWIVCPFVYGYTSVFDYLNSNKRAQIIDKFREFIFDVKNEYGENISLLSHSFGTFVIGKYLSGWDAPPVRFKSIILTGCILKSDLDFSIFDNNAINIINEISRRDTVVKLAHITSRAVDPIIGDSGISGFSTNSTKLNQRECNIFDHNNVIKRDVVLQRWMPELELYARKPF